MKNSALYFLWGCLFILCAVLGFIPEPEGVVRILLTLIAVCFFLPPAVLLFRSGRTGDRTTPALIRNLSALSLAATLILVVLNILCAPGSRLLGDFLHCLLVIVSSPMICSGHWALSLFLWACLLMASLSQCRRAEH